jgi:glycosyltransferase involved in cell wall biosynthesis
VHILVAIPVFNELKYVEHVLAKVKRFHDCILVVDDGSTDGTAELLEGREDIQLIRHPVNRGYGQSLIDAFAYAGANGYEWVITMDCDEQHEPERIPDFIRQIQTDRWDLISGSRYMETESTDDSPPADRQQINRIITARINDLMNLGITDAFCGFKAHRVEPTLALKLDQPGYAFPLQLWPRVAAAGLRLKEIPVRLIYNDPTRHFGGMLDDARKRLEHYLQVLDHEMQLLASARTADSKLAGCSCCCDR